MNHSEKFLKNCEPSPTPADFEAIESIIGESLPIDFVKFLYSENGGNPIRNTWEWNEIELFVQFFYPLSRDVEPNLESEWKISRGEVPDNFLPIALEGHNWLILISLKDGEIWLRMTDFSIAFLSPNIWAFLQALR